MSGSTEKLVRRVVSYLRAKGLQSDPKQVKEQAMKGSHRDRGRIRAGWKRVMEAGR